MRCRPYFPSVGLSVWKATRRHRLGEAVEVPSLTYTHSWCQRAGGAAASSVKNKQYGLSLGSRQAASGGGAAHLRISASRIFQVGE